MKLKTAWFDAWSGELDAALAALPAMESCPHDLYRALLTATGPNPKRIALVTEADTPVALIGVRQLSRFRWEPVLQWLTPGALAPSRPGQLIDAFAALNLEIPIGWWRMPPVPVHPAIRALEETPVYRLKLDEDPEVYWRATARLRSVKNVRNRCKALETRINDPGAAEWTIRGWRKKWGGDDPSLEDRIIVAKHLEAADKHFTLSIHDNGEIVAAMTNIAHQGDLVAGVNFVEPERVHQSAGAHVIDLTFQFARERGFAAVDMGSGHDYKLSWAPIDGMRQRFTISPAHLHYARRALNLAGRVKRKLTSAPAPAADTVEP